MECSHSNKSAEKQAGVNKFQRNINLLLQIRPAVHLNGMTLYKCTTQSSSELSDVIYNTSGDQSESKFGNPICFSLHLNSLFNFCIQVLILIKLQFYLLTFLPCCNAIMGMLQNCHWMLQLPKIKFHPKANI